MRTVVLKGLVTRKLRSLLSALAVVLGVALMSGSYILTDTIEEAYSSILTTSYDQTDVVVRAAQSGNMGTGPVVSTDVLARVRAVSEVEQAEGTLIDFSGGGRPTLLLDGQGDPVRSSGPTFAFGLSPEAERFNPLELVRGRWAARDGEVVLDMGTAARMNVSLGDRVGVLGQGPVQRLTLVGLAEFRDEATTSGAATTMVLDIETAQRLHRTDGFHAVAVAGKQGVTTRELAGAVADVLPAGFEVKSGRQQAAEDLEATSFVGVVRTFLVAFAGVALLVGAFVIVNTLSITVAGRTRELATLRMLGATRRQVRTSIILEGLLLGVVASVAGLAMGFLFAEGLRYVLSELSVEMPDAPTVFRARTAVVSVAVGVVATTIATLIPAVRATRVPPLAAIRDTETAQGQPSRRTTSVALALLAGGAALVGAALVADAPNARLLLVLLGSVVAFVGTGLMAPRLIRPLAAMLARPLALVGEPAALLARDSVVRSANRTASTAAALMVGVALATFSGVVATSVLSSGETAVREQVRTDHIISSTGWTPGGPDDVGRRVAAFPGVTAAASIRTVEGGATLSTGEMVSVSGVDPRIEQLYRFTWAEGSAGSAARLRTDGALVDQTTAEARGVKVGDPLTLHTRESGPVELTVRGIFQAAPFDSLLGQVVMPQDLFGDTFPPHVGALTLVRADAASTVERLAQALPGAELTTPAEIAQARHSELTSILRLLYVLLGVAVLVSVLGMVNTLVLATFERTREIGMLRAIGLTRRQARQMIRYEGVLTAMIGGTLGVAIGLVAGAAVVATVDQQAFAFSVPVGLVAALAAGTALLGVVAAVLPARRAARLNILAALQHE